MLLFCVVTVSCESLCSLPACLRALAHHLDGRHHVRLLVHIGLSEGRGPGDVLVQVCEDRWKLGQRFDAGIPRLGVDGITQLIAFEIRMQLHPAIGFDGLRRVGGRGEDLRDERVRVQRDRGHELLQLLWSLLNGLWGGRCWRRRGRLRRGCERRGCGRYDEHDTSRDCSDG
jgi:hypothetical protein